MAVSSYSFAVNKLTLEYIGEVLGVKPRVLKDKAKELEINSYRLWIEKQLQKVLGKDYPTNILDAVNLLDSFEDYYGFYHSFTRAKHFCVNSLPEEYLTRVLSKDVLNFENEIFLDFKYNGIDGCLDFYKRKSKFYIGDKLITHNLAVFYNRDDCFITTSKGRIIQSAWFIQMHISEDGKIVAMEVPKSNNELLKKLNCKEVEFLDFGKATSFKGTVNLSLKNNDLPERSFLFGILNYVVDCYKYRRTIERKNVKINKHYKQHEVHMSSGDEMNYIPISRYYKEREKKPWQGGHHKSPCEHERSGGFRRVPSGKGKYNLVNGEYVRVPDGTGTHTSVRGTHVGGDKSNKISVYKV